MLTDTWPCGTAPVVNALHASPSPLQRVVDSGLLRCAVPRSLGGKGGLDDLVHSAMLLQQQDPEAAAVLWAQRLAIEALVQTFNVGLRELWLPEFLSGTRAATLAPGCRELTAEDTGRGWLLPSTDRSRLLRSLDGGASWQSVVGHIANPMGMHLYAISRQGSRWFLAGEQGYLARSDDGGASFTQLESPYEGSFFTLQSRADGALLVGGLKGHAFITHDAGASFARAPVPMPVSFSDATRLSTGQVVLANQAGMLFLSKGEALQPFSKPLGVPVSSLVQAADGSLIVAGFTGLLRVPQPATVASE